MRRTVGTSCSRLFSAAQLGQQESISGVTWNWIRGAAGRRVGRESSSDPQVSSNGTGVSGARQTILGIRSKTDSCLGGLAACCSIGVEV